MLRFLGSILSTIFAVLGLFGSLFQHFCDAAARSLNVAPTVPPASDEGKLKELADEEVALQASEDLNATRNWASDTLFGRPCKLPTGRIGEWLSQLDVTHADRIASADCAGVLDRHLAGRELVPGLPPVNDASATHYWCARNRPPVSHPCEGGDADGEAGLGGESAVVERAHEGLSPYRLGGFVVVVVEQCAQTC